MEGEVHGAERDAAEDERRHDAREAQLARGEALELGRDVLEVVERRREEDDSEHALDRLHPGARARQRHRERGEQQEGQAHAEAVDGAEDEAKSRVARRRDVREQAREGRARAGRGDEARDEAHEEGAAEAAAADAREALLQALGQRELEGAEHRQRHGDEEERERHDDPRVAEVGAEGLAEQAEGRAERAEQDGDARDVRRGEHGRPATAYTLSTKDREGDGNHRVDAGGQRREQPETESERHAGRGGHRIDYRRRRE